MAHGERSLTVASFAEFARYVESEAPSDAIFRGHAKKSWELVPEVHRREAIVADNNEARVRAEQEMLREFKRQTRSHLLYPPKDDWEWLALARHYAMPTRLLDWTENAAAALFFAVEYPNGGGDSAVWCSERPAEVDTEKTPFEVDHIYLYEPPHIAPRITAQSACFTAHPTDYIGKRYPWRRELVKLVIPARSRVQMRATLRAHGVHRASLFPEPAGIADEIRRRYGCMDDERELTIISAFYGTDAKSQDITDMLRAFVKDGKLSVTVTNELAGDPCPGERKELRVIYIYQGKRRVRDCAELEELHLP
jgi:hypothetical protein